MEQCCVKSGYFTDSLPDHRQHKNEREGCVVAFHNDCTEDHTSKCGDARWHCDGNRPSLSCARILYEQAQTIHGALSVPLLVWSVVLWPAFGLDESTRHTKRRSHDIRLHLTGGHSPYSANTTSLS